MTRLEFERRMAKLLEHIATLPPAQRESLERLAMETRERHDAIGRSSLRGHRAVERLELAMEDLGRACDRLLGLATEARDAVARANAFVPPQPGMN